MQEYDPYITPISISSLHFIFHSPDMIYYINRYTIVASILFSRPYILYFLFPDQQKVMSGGTGSGQGSPKWPPHFARKGCQGCQGEEPSKRGYIGVIYGLYWFILGLYWVIQGIMEKKMEATI